MGSVFSFKQGVQCGVEFHHYEPAEGLVRFVRIIDLTQKDEPPRYIEDPGRVHHISEDDLFLVRYGVPGLVGYGYCGVIANNLFRLLPVDADKIETTFYRFVFEGKKRDLEAISGSSTMPAINFTSLKRLQVPKPSLPEQRKIADFLTAVDGRIGQLIQKKALLEDYKKGVMQQLFTQAIRFKDDRGNDFPDWEEKKFTEVMKTVSPRGFQIESSAILPDGEYRVIDQGKVKVAGYCNDSDKVMCEVPVIVFGDHTTVIKYIDFEFVVGADGTKILVSKDAENDLKYLFYNLVQNNVTQEGYKRHFSILKEIVMQVPTPSEQTKIADFLSAIDRKIESVTTQITETQTFKRGLLQQMFV